MTCFILHHFPVVSHRFWVEVLEPAFPPFRYEIGARLGAFELYKFGA